MGVYEKNLAVLIAVNPELGAALSSVQGNVDFEVFVDNNDPLNTNLLHVKTNQPLFLTKPIDETLKRVEELETKYSRYPMLYMYGFGNGVLAKALLQNSMHQRIVVVEPQLELIYIALNLMDLSKEIQEGRLIIYLSSQLSFPIALELFSHKDAKVFVKTYEIIPFSPFYEYNFSDEMLHVNRLFLRAIEHVVHGLGNDSSDALMGLEYHLANAPKVVQTPTLVEFVNKASSTDIAIIVSTGPSLKKQLPLLKKIAPYVTIFSVDASFPILASEGIQPDVVVSIERVYETAKFYKETPKEFHDKAIFCFSSIVHPSLIDSIKGGTLQLNLRPFGYTKALGIHNWGYVGVGMSAANLAYELVFHSKFQTCVLIGQDLAFGKDGATHSDGHLYGVTGKNNKGILEIESYGGNGSVKTTTIWNLFKNFFEQDIAVANQSGMQTINATEGGARIHGAIEVPFEKVCETYVDTKKTKESITLTLQTPEEIEQNTKHVIDKIASMEKFAKDIYKEAEELFTDVNDACEAMDKIKARKHPTKVDVDALAALMARIDDFKANFDKEEFVNIFIDASQAMIVHQELDLAKIQVRPSETEEAKRLKMIDWIYAHQQWLFIFAGIAKAVVVAIERRGDESRFIHKAKLDDKGYSANGYFGDYTCKDTQFEIEMLIDGKVAKSLHVNTKGKEKINFSIPVPSKFFDNHLHEVMLREKNTGIILMGTPVTRVYLEQDKNQALFMESLENIDEEKIKDLYCPNAIGFLATEENLADEEFVGYIKELMERFSDVEFKGFYFGNKYKNIAKKIFKNETNRLNLLEICDIYDLVSNIELYLISEKAHDCLGLTLYKYSNEVHHIVHHGSNKNKKFSDFYNPQHDWIQNPQHYGFTCDEIENSKNNPPLLIFNKIFKILGTLGQMSEADSIYKAQYFDKIYYLLKYKNIKHFIISVVKKFVFQKK